MFNTDCRLSEDCANLDPPCDSFDLGDCSEDEEEAGECEDDDRVPESGTAKVILSSFYNLHRVSSALPIPKP